MSRFGTYIKKRVFLDKFHLYRPTAEVSVFQKNVYSAAVEFFMKLPQSIINNANGKVQLNPLWTELIGC
jgi:hypothetical protein